MSEWVRIMQLISILFMTLIVLIFRSFPAIAGGGGNPAIGSPYMGNWLAFTYRPNKNIQARRQYIFVGGPEAGPIPSKMRNVLKQYNIDASQIKLQPNEINVLGYTQISSGFDEFGNHPRLQRLQTENNMDAHPYLIENHRNIWDYVAKKMGDKIMNEIVAPRILHRDIIYSYYRFAGVNRSFPSDLTKLTLSYLGREQSFLRIRYYDIRPKSLWDNSSYSLKLKKEVDFAFNPITKRLRGENSIRNSLEISFNSDRNHGENLISPAPPENSSPGNPGWTNNNGSTSWTIPPRVNFTTNQRMTEKMPDANSLHIENVD